MTLPIVFEYVPVVLDLQPGSSKQTAATAIIELRKHMDSCFRNRENLDGADRSGGNGSFNSG